MGCFSLICSGISPIVLPLRIKDALPVVCFVGPPHVGVDENLHISAKEIGLAIKYLERLGAAHDCADDAANEWRGGTPPVRLPGEDVERCAILGIYDLVANNLTPNTQGGSDWGALVRNRKNLPSTGLAEHHVNTLKAHAQQHPTFQLFLIHSRRIPHQRRKNSLGCILPCGLGPESCAAQGCCHGRKQSTAGNQGRSTNSRGTFDRPLIAQRRSTMTGDTRGCSWAGSCHERHPALLDQCASCKDGQGCHQDMGEFAARARASHDQEGSLKGTVG